jgi:hypothetical protein
VLVGKLLRFGVNAGLAGFDHPEKPFRYLRVDFGKDGITLDAGDLSSVDSEIQRIPNFQEAQWGEKNRLRGALYLFPDLRRGSLCGKIKGDDESRVGVGQDS